MRKTFTLIVAFISLILMDVSAQITEKPLGEEKLYVRTGSAFAPQEGSADIKVSSQTGKAARIVFGSDGTTVYFSNPVSLFTEQSWVKGTLDEDTKTITVPMGQLLGHDSKHNTDYVLAVLKSSEVSSGGETYLEYERDMEATSVEYKIDGGDIYLSGSSQDCVLGVVYADNNQWTGYGDYNTLYTAINDETLTLPENVKVSDYTLYATDGDKNISRTVKIGITDTDVYVQGLSKLIPEAWAKGAFNDNKRIVTFPIQFLGITATDYPVYLCRYAGGESIDELVLVYESESSTFYISQRDQPIMLENGSKTTAGYYYKYENLTFALGEDCAVKPVDDSGKGKYMLKSFTYSGDKSQLVNVLFTDDKLYVQGLCSQLPDSWVIASKTTDGYEMASPQYLGRDTNNKPYFLVVETKDGIADKCVFIYNSDKKTLSTKSTCGISTDRVKVRDVETFYGIDLVPYTEASGAVPADPEIDDIYPSDCELDFTVTPVSTKGDDLDVSKLSMVFYSDIEGVVAPITFSSDDYPEFESAVTSVPVGFSSDNFGDGWMIYPANDDFNRVGLQLVYTTDDGETRSNIVWAVIKPYVTGITPVTAEDTAPSCFYTVSGMVTNKPFDKIVIERRGKNVRKVAVR